MSLGGASVTGWKYPTIQMAWQGTSGTQGTFANPDNILAEDDLWATFYNNDYKNGVYSAVCRVRGFDFSEIPEGAVILGIEVQTHRSTFYDGYMGYGTANVNDSRVSLAMHTSATVTSSTTSPDTRGSNYASTDWWGNFSDLPTMAEGSTTKLYGGASDTWASGLTVADIKSAAFSVDLQANAVGYKSTGYVNYIKVRVYYGSEPVPEPSTSVSATPAPCLVVITPRAATTSAKRSFTAATNRRSVVLTRRTPTTSAARNFSAYPTSASLSLTTQSATATATQVIAQTITSPSTLNVGSYSGNYEVARTGAGLTTGIYGWVGQHFTGSSYEISQVFLGFDLSAVPNREITKAELRFTVNEAYGVNTVEARLHDWQDASSFVSGADLASKPLLGSTSVSAGQTGAKVISLTGVTRSSLLKIVLAGADQRTGTPPVGDDTTLLLSAGASLYLEFGDEISSVNATATPSQGAVAVTALNALTSATANFSSNPASAAITTFPQTPATSSGATSEPQKPSLTTTAITPSVGAGSSASPVSKSVVLTGRPATASVGFQRAPTAASLWITASGALINVSALSGALKGNLSIVVNGPSVQSGTVAAPIANPLTIAPSSASSNASANAGPAKFGVSITGLKPTTFAQRNLVAAPLATNTVLAGQSPTTENGASASTAAGSLVITGLMPMVWSTTTDEARPLAATIILTGRSAEAQSSASATAFNRSMETTGKLASASATTNTSTSPTSASLVFVGKPALASTSSNVTAYPQFTVMALTPSQTFTSATRAFTAMAQQGALTFRGNSPFTEATTNSEAQPSSGRLTLTAQPAASTTSTEANALAGILELLGLEVIASATVSPFVVIIPTPERTIIGQIEGRLVSGKVEVRTITALPEVRSAIARAEVRRVAAKSETRLAVSETENRHLSPSPEPRLFT